MKPTVPEVLPMVRDYYALPGNAAGGNLHIVLDDGNINDHSIMFCRQQCLDLEDSLGLVLCDLLIQMSKTQRIKMHNSHPSP